jgi:polysaccharide deacetylase family protein (PEP-CTERM system associated)
MINPQRSATDLPLNAMTVDVEEHFQVSAFESIVRRESWSSLESRVEPNTERVLDLLDACGVSGTFFVLGWVAERRPALVRRIAERGHEVASHGYSHRLIYEQTPEEFGRELTRSRKILQDASGQPILGHRAASFSIVKASLWALDAVAEAGFTYDSSVFPVLHDRYGMAGAPRGIHRLTTPAGHALWEIPPSTVALGGVVLPVAGGGYLRLYPAALTGWAIRRLNCAERMPAVVYIHPWELDPEQPRFDPGTLRRFRHYVNLKTTARKLRGLMARHRFGTMHDVLAGHRGPVAEAEPARVAHGV